MDKDVMITVSGMLFVGSGKDEKDYIDVISPGQYYLRGGKHYLVYDEIAEGCDVPIHNILKMNDEQVSLRKSGIITTEMQFRPGAETFSQYTTPYGVLDFAIQTEKIQIDESDQVLSADVRYRLTIHSQVRENCFIRVKVQPRTPDGGFRL